MSYTQTHFKNMPTCLLLHAIFFMISVPAFFPCGNFILQNVFVGSRCAMVTLGAPPNPRISKMVLDYPYGVTLSNILMSIVITCITMGIPGTTLNELVQLISHLLWVMFPLLSPLLNVRYVVPHMYAFICVMLE